MAARYCIACLPWSAAMWPDSRLLSLLEIDLPIIQAPMAGADSPELASAVSAAGGLGSLACAMRSPAEIETAVHAIRARTERPFSLNFFCHAPPRSDAERSRVWLERLARYYDEFGVPAPPAPAPGASLPSARQPFDDALCELVVALRPPVVSFHFGLPSEAMLSRLRAAGCRVLCSATTPEEAIWLQGRGVDAVIAQGVEAGGHRGVFIEDWRAGSGQIGTMALVPQIVDAVEVPVIAAGGIADGRAIAACFALGAAGVQIGTAFLFCPESTLSGLHRAALEQARADATVLTNVFTGRPARALANRMTRELGPIATEAPEFPVPAAAAVPLRQAAEATGSADFTPLWSGQAAALGRALPAFELTRLLADETRIQLQRMDPAAERRTVR
jgi:nitronate monooxygenase